MKIIIILIPLLCLLSCTEPASTVDMRTAKYVAKIAHLTHKQFRGSIIFYKDERASALGFCTFYKKSSSRRTIYINEPKWDRLSEVGKEQLVLHELGHCLLGREHVETIMPNGCPLSIMFPNHIADVCYVSYYKYYIKELIKGQAQLFEVEDN